MTIANQGPRIGTGGPEPEDHRSEEERRADEEAGAASAVAREAERAGERARWREGIRNETDRDLIDAIRQRCDDSDDDEDQELAATELLRRLQENR
jgi:hypothetical protein